MKHIFILSVAAAALMAVSCKKEISNNAATSVTNANASLSTGTSDHEGDVYVLNNSRIDNKVVHYIRSSDGMLVKEKSYSTGGIGSGFPLGSQGAVCLSSDHHWLFAVNPHSNDISAFMVTESGLQLTDRVSSNGVNPVSLAQYGDRLYVLNTEAALNGRVAGYTISASGKLTMIANSAMDINHDKNNPAEIAFNNDGTALLITLKRSQQIVSSMLDAHGVPGVWNSTTSAGIEPFGFAVGEGDNLYVAEAFAGAEGMSTVSSYHVNSSAVVSVVSPLVQNHQTASCWLTLTHDYKYAYVSNTGSSTISAYTISHDGSLALINNDGVTAMSGTAPIDADISWDSKYLYVLNADDKNIRAFSINASNGALTEIGDFGDLLHNAAGLAAK